MEIDGRVVSFFIDNGLCDNNFFDFIYGKIVYLESGSDVFWYGCHPILEDNIIRDIRLVVPIVEKEKDLLINIHEFTHALELYNELGSKYVESRDLREEKAKNMEKLYFLQKVNKCS